MTQDGGLSGSKYLPVYQLRLHRQRLSENYSKYYKNHIDQLMTHNLFCMQASSKPVCSPIPMLSNFLQRPSLFEKL